MAKRSNARKRWGSNERCWAVQCDGGVGFIHGTNSRTRSGAIEAFMAALGPKDPTWDDLSGPAGHYRVVKVEITLRR